jgi:hypothetical protein
MAMDTMTLSATVDRPSRDDVGVPASRWPGTAIAFSIAFAAGLIGLGFEAPFLLLGIPAATAAGWFLGPKLPPSGGLAGVAIGMAVLTTAIADALVVVPSAVASLSSSFGGIDPLTAGAGALASWGIGLVIVGIPMLIITAPCGLVWAVLVRTLARRAR